MHNMSKIKIIHSVIAKVREAICHRGSDYVQATFGLTFGERKTITAIKVIVLMQLHVLSGAVLVDH